MERRAFLRTGLAAGVASATPVSLHGMSWLFDPRHAQDGVIRLSSNENPLGLAPVAREAVLEGREEANRYPGASRRALIEVLAPYVDVPPERLFFGAGSTEILRVAVQAWSTPNAKLVLASPTFEDVPGYARPFPFQVESVPLTADHAHDIGRMREIVDGSSNPAIVYICNPNNPTGTLTSSAEVDAWIGEASDQTLFLVDEAYLEYANDPGYWSAQRWTAERTNVLVVRTFSKIYAMAGMRVGYGIAHPKTVQRMRPFLTRNNPNHMAAVAAAASLTDSELVGRSVDVNTRAKTIAHECLDDLGLEYLPTHTNFLMHRIQGELRTYIGRMAEQGIRVGRPFPPMLEYNRLSFGLPEEMERFAETLRGFRARGWV
jgi:histidinol-phosphate aminotransferase